MPNQQLKLPEINLPVLPNLSFISDEIFKMQGVFKSVAQSMQPILNLAEQVNTSIAPILGLAQAALERQRAMSEFINPRRIDFVISREAIVQKPGLTYSDIPYISDVIANKLKLREKISRKLKRIGSGYLNIHFKNSTLFLPENLENKYIMRRSQKRMEMLTLLINAGKEFTMTGDIRKYAGSSSNETVRKELKTLDNKIRTALDLSEDLFECIPGIGYRINPRYKIRMIS